MTEQDLKGLTKNINRMIAENIISQPKYSNKLKNLVLICEAMDEFAEALIKENKELKKKLKDATK